MKLGNELEKQSIQSITLPAWKRQTLIIGLDGYIAQEPPVLIRW